MPSASDTDRVVTSTGETYPAFLLGFNAELVQPQRPLLSVAVHPKTSEPGNWNGAQAQNYSAIRSVVDRFRVMAYDHWSTSAAGAIAPVGWGDEVARFASTVVAPPKIQLGFGLYGYDWVANNGEPLTYDVVISRMNAAGDTAIGRLLTRSLGTPTPSTACPTRVWYADVSSLSALLPVVDRYGLRGAVFWRLGGDDPAVWTSALEWGLAADPYATKLRH